MIFTIKFKVFFNYNFLLLNSMISEKVERTHMKSEIYISFLSSFGMLKRNYIYIFCHVKTDALLHFKQKDEKVLVYFESSALTMRSFNS